MPPLDTRRHGARQGCKAGEPRVRRQTPVNQVAMGKFLNVRHQPSSELTSQNGLIGLVQKDTVTRATGFPICGVHSKDPADSTALTRQKTNIRNGITPRSALSKTGRSESRVSPAGRPGGGMAQEAKASGNARGYADVSPVVWKVERPVGVHTA